MSATAATSSTFRVWLANGGAIAGLVSLAIGLVMLGLAFSFAVEFAEDNALRLARQELLSFRKTLAQQEAATFLDENSAMDFPGAAPARIRVVVDADGGQRPVVSTLENWVSGRVTTVRDLPPLMNKVWWLDDYGHETGLLTGAHWLLVASPVGDDDIGFVAFNLSSEKAFLTVLLYLAGLFAVAIVVTSLLVAWFSFRRFEKNLGTINRFLVGVSDTSNLTERLSSDLSPEFQMLSQHINSMLDRLGRAIAGIEKATRDLAHDLRTPLARAALLLRRRAEADDDDRMNDASYEIERLAETFETLTGIAKLDADGKTQLEPTRLGGLVESTLDLFIAAFEERDISVKAEIDPDVMVNTDPQLAQRVLLNVLDNATKYTAAGGSVVVALNRAGNANRFVITNRPATGITEDEQAQIGRKFFRSNAADQSGSSGYGLGLSFVRAAMRNLGGSANWRVKNDEFELVLDWPDLPVDRHATGSDSSAV